MNHPRKILIAYIPVLSQNYLRFIANHPDASEFLIFSDEVINLFPQLRKDLRRVNPIAMLFALRSLRLSCSINLLTNTSISLINQLGAVEIIMPDEDISHSLAARLLPRFHVNYDSRVRLRWDKTRISLENEIAPNGTVQPDEFMRRMFGRIEMLAQKSDDWFRQVAGIIVHNQEILLTAYNFHLPLAGPLFEGDPRANFQKGIAFELSTAAHAETQLIARAAYNGISLCGAELFINTFPCPPCARLLAFSGISRLYFLDGYSVMDGAELLKTVGIELIRVQLEKKKTC